MVGLALDKEAVELAEQASVMSESARRVTFTDQPLKELTFTKEATHIIVASHVENKQEVLEDLRQLTSSQAKILIRYGNGLKSLFNYTWQEGNDLTAWTQRSMDTPSQLYDTIILEKAMQVKGI